MTSVPVFVAVVMIMGVVMLAATIIPVLVVMHGVIILMVMVCMVRVLTAGLVIGTTLRMKGGFNLDNLGTKATEHISNDMIPPDADEFGRNLALQMPVAQMVCDACRVQ